MKIFVCSCGWHWVMTRRWVYGPLWVEEARLGPTLVAAAARVRRRKRWEWEEGACATILAAQKAA